MPEAQAWLGLYYSAGIGVTKDLTQAYKWTVLADEQGADIVKQTLPLFIKQLSPEQRSNGEALAREWKSDRKSPHSKQ